MSLFRPIRCVSPSPSAERKATPPSVSEGPRPTLAQTQEDKSNTNAVLQDPTDQVAPTNSEPAPSVPTSCASDPPKRPCVLRLQSESSAFRETANQRPAVRQSTDFGFARTSSRDRSSSRESSASSASCCEDLRKASDRRLSVRELAESINRKHGKDHRSRGVAQGSAPARKLPQPKKYKGEKQAGDPSQADVVAEPNKTVPSKGDSDVMAPHSRPLALKAAIERRGTVERYRDCLRQGVASHSRRSHGAKKSEDHLARAVPRGPNVDPRLSLFVGNATNNRIPTRGILKNSGIPTSGARACPSTASVSCSSDVMSTTADSGFVTDVIMDAFSGAEGSSQVKSSSSPQRLTSPESETALEDTKQFNHVRDSLSNLRMDDPLFSPTEPGQPAPARPKQLRRVGQAGAGSSRKPRALMHYQKKHRTSTRELSTSQSEPDSPVATTRSLEEEAASSSPANSYNRCPSAPAAALLDACDDTPACSTRDDDDDDVADEMSTASDVTWSETYSGATVCRWGRSF